MSAQDRLNKILAEYQQTQDQAEQAAAAARSKQRELLEANPDLADELKELFSNQQGTDATVTLGQPLSNTASFNPQDIDATLPHSPTSRSGSTEATFGDYQLLSEIAKGGMGVVYKARQVGLDRVVALKMIRSGELADEGEVERFHTEARAAAKLDHSGILPVHEIGEIDGQHFFTMRVGRMEKSWLWCKRRPVVTALLATLFLVVTIGSAVAWERSNAQFSEGLVDSLVKAEPSQVKGYINQIEDYQWWTRPLLDARYSETRDGSIEKVYLGLALLRFDDSHLEALRGELLKSDPRNFPVLRDELVPHKEHLTEELWTVFRDESEEKRRFRAGLTLANYAHDDEQWTAEDAKFLAASLLSQVPEDQPLYRGYLVDFKEQL